MKQQHGVSIYWGLTRHDRVLATLMILTSPQPLQGKTSSPSPTGLSMKSSISAVWMQETVCCVAESSEAWTVELGRTIWRNVCS